MKPFLKWAGGKTQLLPAIRSYLPTNIDALTTYVEPFVGAGAVFINFLESDSFDRYIINDINSRLINLYLVIRDDVELLIDSLSTLRDTYLSLDTETDERKEMYYEIRTKFNGSDIDRIELASYFIFLNKTCFNGLFRENAKGGFNVPIGSYKNNPDMFDETILRKLSYKLNEKNKYGENKVLIFNKSYLELEEYIDENTFLYFDPPYRPVTKGGFNTYDKGGFNDDSQRELALFFEKMSNKGAKVMLSNSDPKNLDENDEFFDDLYSNFTVQRVSAVRAINSNGKGRSAITEILVYNYEIL